MLDKAQLYTNNQPINAINITDNKSALKEQTDQFEALILKKILDIAMTDEDPLFPKTPGKSIYSSMYKDELSKELAGGFGYSELLFEFLTRDDITK